MRTLTARLAQAQDAILAAALAAAVLVELAATGIPGLDDFETQPGQLAIAIAIASWLAVTSALARRRRHPLGVLAVAVVAGLTSLAGPLEGPVGATAAFGLIAYTTGAHLHGRQAALGAIGVLGIAVGAAIHPTTPLEELGDLATVVAMVGGPWLVGIAVRERRTSEAALQARLAMAEHDREARAAAAVAVERTRIARELHDVVAHAIAVIVLQARGARRSIAGDSEAATEALGVIETTGSEALAEMRRLVGLLRDAAVPASNEPAPGLASLDTLLGLVRDAGLPVDLQVEGPPRPLPPGVDLAAYRVVQEALTNALVHAGPACATVTVRYEDAGVELDIEDTGGGPGAAEGEGHGIVGMTERVQLYGGQLRVGRRPGGGFGVHATLPTRGQP